MIDDANLCDIYAGTVLIYGEGNDALAVIRAHLDLDGTAGIHPRLERIFYVKLSDDMAVVSEQANDDTPSSSAAGISVAVVALSIGIVGAAIFLRRRRTRQSQLSAGSNVSGIESASDNKPVHDADYADSQDVEEVIRKDKVDLQFGSSLVLEDGRPTYSTYVNELL
jgi:hypothetical protein